MNYRKDEMEPAINIITNNNCAGCYGCINVCKQNAIKMNLNNEGFLMPCVDAEKCIKCGMCQQYCPILNNEFIKQFNNLKTFAAWSRNDHIRTKSSSGGVFTEIAKTVLKDGGVVFGVAFDSSFRVRHISIESEKELDLIRGSKYIQSHVEDAYKKAVSIALQGRPVLFSGTPCQIAALNLLIKDNPGLDVYTCEVICHGVPSESVFMSYLDYISQLYGSQVKEYSFRDKTNGWKKYGTKIVFSNEEEYFQMHQSDPFMIGYLRNIYLRPICYDCPFAKIPRVSDITLGDFWGVPKELDDPKGVSAVIINTPKGEKLFKKVNNIEKVNVSIGKIVFHNIRLINGHLERVSYRKNFYKLLETNGFQSVSKKYLKSYSLYEKCLFAPKYVFGILSRYICRIVWLIDYWRHFL